MSSAANWSYTATATHWSLLGRDDWTGANTFGLPVQFQCDYTAEAKRETDAAGAEFVTRQTIYTERVGIKPGDWVLIGVSSDPSPLAAGAEEVRAVGRFADTFERLADDFRVVT